MRIFIAMLLVLGAHLSLTANVPAQAGEAWLFWPFAVDSRARLNLPGRTPDNLTRLLCGVLFPGWMLPALRGAG